MKNFIITMCLTIICFYGSQANAILIDPYDNAPAPDGLNVGLFYQNYYHADEFTDNDGDKAVDADLTANVSILRYLRYEQLGNWLTAFQVIVPFGQIEEKKVFNEKSSGLGDVIFGPGLFLYSNDQINTHISYWFYAFAPTGEWDKDKAINLGLNHWYFEHQLAISTIYKKLIYDMNLNYYQHTEESDNNFQSPDRFEIETSLAYQVTDKLVVGLNAGGYVDMDDAEVDGVSIADSKAERWQVGPTLGYTINDQFGINLRWTNDVISKNDSKGNDIWLRASYCF